jgi:surface antigen
VLACDGREVCRRSLYNRMAALRLCRWPGRALSRRRLHRIRPAVLVAALCAVSVSGCSYQLASLVSADNSDPQATGAVASPLNAATGDKAAPSSRVELDLAYAREAISNVLLHGGKDTSIPWQNPQTGAGGNIMPLATSYSEAGVPCRDFLASYVHGESQDWLQGAACRTTHGTWEVKRLKSLKSG